MRTDFRYRLEVRFRDCDAPGRGPHVFVTYGCAASRSVPIPGATRAALERTRTGVIE